MLKKFTLSAILFAGATIAGVGGAAARDQIRIVGSSTVFPFTATVVEQFGQASKFPPPVLESTGTGGGFKLFCAGASAEHPDLIGASRAIKKSEFETCRKNGVSQITELKIGYDGLSIVQNKAGPKTAVSKAQLFQALAKEVEVDGQVVANPFRRWSDIDKSLPDVAIEVLGPAPTSGSRDAWVELVMEPGCKAFAAIRKLPEARQQAVCRTLREDGAFIEAGENDNLIVQRLVSNANAFGIFGYSFLEENIDRLRDVPVDGVSANYETIASGQYPVSRPLFIYVKNQHVGVIPGVKEFVAEYTNSRAMGKDGYLEDKGLISLPAEELAMVQAAAKTLTPMVAPGS